MHIQYTSRAFALETSAYGTAEIVIVDGFTIEFADDAAADKRSYRVSFEKIRRKPQWDARMGAEQLYKAYRSSGLTLEEFEDRDTSASAISKNYWSRASSRIAARSATAPRRSCVDDLIPQR